MSSRRRSTRRAGCGKSSTDRAAATSSICVERGKNYGWPLVAYGIEYSGSPIAGAVTAREGYEQPVYYWDPVIAPSGMQFYTGDAFPAWRGSVFIGGMRATGLVRLTLKDDRVTGEEHLLADRGQRVRDVRAGAGRRAVRRHRRRQRRALEDRPALKMARSHVFEESRLRAKEKMAPSHFYSRAARRRARKRRSGS